jgi:hypothetical protein
MTEVVAPFFISLSVWTGLIPADVERAPCNGRHAMGAMEWAPWNGRRGMAAVERAAEPGGYRKK